MTEDGSFLSDPGFPYVLCLWEIRHKTIWAVSKALAGSIHLEGVFGWDVIILLGQSHVPGPLCHKETEALVPTRGKLPSKKPFERLAVCNRTVIILSKRRRTVQRCCGLQPGLADKCL